MKHKWIFYKQLSYKTVFRCQYCFILHSESPIHKNKDLNTDHCMKAEAGIAKDSLTSILQSKL